MFAGAMFADHTTPHDTPRHPPARILIRWSKKDKNHLALLQLSSGLIAFKKAHLATIAAAQPG
jgi:hypothetical protein